MLAGVANRFSFTVIATENRTRDSFPTWIVALPADLGGTVSIWLPPAGRSSQDVALSAGPLRVRRECRPILRYRATSSGNRQSGRSNAKAAPAGRSKPARSRATEYL